MTIVSGIFRILRLLQLVLTIGLLWGCGRMALTQAAADQKPSAGKAAETPGQTSSKKSGTQKSAPKKSGTQKPPDRNSKEKPGAGTRKSATKPETSGSGTSSAPAPSPTVGHTLSKPQAGKKTGESWDGNPLKMEFLWCEPGRFLMGSPPWYSRSSV